MKLTYNNGETIVTIEGTQEEVFSWYKTFVHSQIACELSYENAIVGLDKSGNIEASMPPPTVFGENHNPVNDPRAGEPDKDGWMTWTATDVSLPPIMLKRYDWVEYVLRDGYTYTSQVHDLSWTKFPIGREGYDVVKFRLSK